MPRQEISEEERRRIITPKLFPCNPHTYTFTTREGRPITIKMKSPCAWKCKQLYGERSWQQAAINPSIDMSRPWDRSWPCWGITAPWWIVILDFDISKVDPTLHGFIATQYEIGAPYGSTAFPRTTLVRTPSGGLHAWYRIPSGIRLLDIAHSYLPDWKVAFPLDLRIGGLGLVIAPGSRTDAGLYRVVDMPGPDGVPELTPELMNLLTRLGANADHQTAKPAPIPSCIITGRPSFGDSQIRIRQEMVNEGNRHNRLRDQIWGLMHHHDITDPHIIEIIDAGIRRHAALIGISEGEINQLIDRTHMKMGIS